MKHALLIALFAFLTHPSNASVDISAPAIVSIEPGRHGEQIVLGRFMVDTSTAIAWDTLAGYDTLGLFVPSIRESHRVKEQGGSIYVRQVMSGKLGVLRKKITVLLELTEHEPHKIEFRDVSGSSFKIYEGSWEIVQWDNGLVITYRLRADPNFFVPGFVANSVFKRDVTALLESVRQEMIRRTYLASPEGSNITSK